MNDDEFSPANGLRLSLMEVSDLFSPFRDWLEGNRAAFEAAGYTPEEARSMASAEYVFFIKSLPENK